MRRLFERHGYWILECAECGHRSAEITPAADHVAEQYGDAYFFGGGAGYSDYLAEAGLLRDRGRQYGRLLHRYRAPGRVLDVGSAAGCILQGLGDEGCRRRSRAQRPLRGARAHGPRARRAQGHAGGVCQRRAVRCRDHVPGRAPLHGSARRVAGRRRTHPAGRIVVDRNLGSRQSDGSSLRPALARIQSPECPALVLGRRPRSSRQQVRNGGGCAWQAEALDQRLPCEVAARVQTARRRQRPRCSPRCGDSFRTASAFRIPPTICSG